MPQRILNEDWTEYDIRKAKESKDRAFFSCEEQWEVDFLIRLIKKHLPHHRDDTIRSAIASCCGSLQMPRPRKIFVDCVVKKL